MGNLREIWEFWGPLVLGGVAIALLALFTVGFVSYQKSEQQAYVQSLKDSPTALVAKNEVDERYAIDSARAQALASIERSEAPAQ